MSMSATEYANYTGESLEDVVYRIAERAEIIATVDEQACHRCGKSFPEGLASDPTWHIDSYQDGRDDTGQPIVVADIFCPTCF